MKNHKSDPDQLSLTEYVKVSDGKMVSIVILTHNRAELLDKLLSSFQGINENLLECIVVDNHSEDNTQEIVREKHPECVLLETDSNIGVGARNLGLREANGEIIICLDDDVFGIDAIAIKTISDFFNKEPSLGALNFKVIDYYSNIQCNWIHHCKMEEFSELTFRTYEITEGAVAFRKEALTISGYYPENFFISHEGFDLALRLIDNGFDVMYTSDIIVKHCHSNLGRKSWFRYYYDTRNQYWVAARNLPFFYALKYLLRGQISTLVYSIRDGFFKYWLKAVVDGIVGLSDVLSERKIVSERTRNVINEIDNYRPSLFYMIKKRLFRNEMRF